MPLHLSIDKLFSFFFLKLFIWLFRVSMAFLFINGFSFINVFFVYHILSCSFGSIFFIVYMVVCFVCFCLIF
jgi:hypothetical protein